MNFKRLILIIILLNGLQSFAQVNPSKKDSSNVYDKIETYSKKRKSTKFLHKLIFKSTTKKPNRNIKASKKQSLSPFEGKIIRNIKIQSHDPFGFSFTDSTETANSWLEKTGNNIHIKTKPFAVRNFLLIKKNEPLDSLTLSESERLLRSQNFIRSVEIKVKDVGISKDSVDVFIDVLDSWSLIPKIDLSASKNTFRLRDRNFLGFGHQFDNSITNRLDDGKKAYNFRYVLPNFKNTFISTSLGYDIDLNGFYGTYFKINRPFYSPLTKWAGGIYVDEQYRKEPLLNEALESNEQNFKYQSQDVWAGRSFKLFEGNSEKERTTHLIGSVRLLHLDYKETPSIDYDSIRYFSNETFFIGSMGITSRQFIQDSYIFQDGITEDVPVGTVYAMTGGVQHKNQSDRLYLGAKISHGNYFDWGYLSTNFEYGTFINNGKLQQTAYSFQANYFTNLISLGERWKMRQFLKPQFIIGINRLNSIGDRLTIDEHNRFQGVYGNDEQRENSAGIPGFKSDLMGTKKYVLSLQSQFYSPWEVLGFRLNPYVNVTTGLLGNEGTSITKIRLYSAFRVGFIVRNDYLVFSSFQLSLSYYPSIPSQGDHIFNTNSFETEDFGFQNFELGKPTPVWYN
ncbi:MAG: hypothetical protein R2797_11205 [Gelidibacter sp.]